VARLFFEQRQDHELQVLGSELAPASHAAPAFQETADLGETVVAAMAPHMAVMMVIVIMIPMPEFSKVGTHDVSFYRLNDIS
jgi:hypothetical protein